MQNRLTFAIVSITIILVSVGYLPTLDNYNQLTRESKNCSLYFFGLCFVVILDISHLLSRVCVFPKCFSFMGLPLMVLRKVLISTPLAFGMSGYFSISIRFFFLLPFLSYNEEIRLTAIFSLSLPIETTLRFLPLPPTSSLSLVMYTLPRMYFFFLLVLITSRFSCFCCCQ